MVTNIPTACMTYKEFPHKIPSNVYLKIDDYFDYLKRYYANFKLNENITLGKLIESVRILENLKTKEEF